MITDRLRNLSFLIVIGGAVVLSVVTLLRAPLGEILFDSAGVIKWPQVVILILVEVVFVSILVGDEAAHGALLAKTVVLLGLSVLLATTGGGDWFLYLPSSEVSAAVAVPSGGQDMDLNHLVSFLNVPYVMLGLFGVWFLRTSLWPAFAR